MTCTPSAGRSSSTAPSATWRPIGGAPLVMRPAATRFPRSAKDNRTSLACAREADALMTGRIGVMGATAEHWYYAGRDHLFFAVEADIHHGELTALALQRQPPGLRERLGGSRELALDRVSLLK